MKSVVISWVFIVLLLFVFGCIENNKFRKLCIEKIDRIIELLVIGGASLYITCSQYIITKNNIQPFFQMKAYTLDSNSGIINGNAIIDIYNKDGKADNVETEIVTALYIDYYNGKNKQYKVIDYYGVNIFTGFDIGKICTYLNPENNIKFKNLYDEYISSANINIESCIKIKYYDITKKYHEEYYLVKNNKTEHYIDINEGKHKFNNIKNIKNVIELNNFTKDYIEKNN